MVVEMRQIALKDLPVYPLYDELSLSHAHTREQVDWLLRNGTLYRSLPAYVPDDPFDDHFWYHEMFCRGGIYSFVEYAPGYHSDDEPDPSKVTMRQYQMLGALFEGEQVRNVADCAHDVSDPGWHWTHYEPALLASGEGE
jgi:hypothetical protein